MKKRYTEEQIIKAIKDHGAEVKVVDFYPRLGISTDTFYNWRSRYAGVEANEAKRTKELDVNRSSYKYQGAIAHRMIFPGTRARSPESVGSLRETVLMFDIYGLSPPCPMHVSPWERVRF